MAPDDATPLALSIVDTARTLGISRSSVYNLIWSGDLPAHKIGKRTLILHADIEQFLSGLPSVTTGTH